MMHIAVLGLGEAGSIYAADIAARGATVRGADPHVAAAPPGVALATDIADAVRGADLVLSLVGAEPAASVFESASPAMEPHAVFADMNTASPADKRRLASAAQERDVAFADVAILAPVPRARIDTPLLVSGSGADRLAPLLARLDVPFTHVGDQPGAAAQLKLLRSVFMKGLAAVVYESVEAAETVGARDWVIAQIAGELGPDGADTVQHLLDGTAKHAVRRAAEMRDVRDMLASLGARHLITDAAIDWLDVLVARDR